MDEETRKQLEEVGFDLEEWMRKVDDNLLRMWRNDARARLLHTFIRLGMYSE